jgi:uncharacterized protein (TIGR03437 family)
MRRFLLILAALPALADDSVFVNGAFNGTWTVFFPPQVQSSGSITFSPTSQSTAETFLSLLGGSDFVTTFCPPNTQKREYYSATYTFSGGGTAYACTNGTRLHGRYSNQNATDTGRLDIDVTNPGSSPNWSGTLRPATGAPPYAWRADYATGGIATPLANTPPDDVSLVSTSPLTDSSISAGSLRDFSAVVQYKMNQHLQGSVRLVLSNAQQQTIAFSADVPVRLADPRAQTELRIAGVPIPQNTSQLFLRAEMRLPNGSATASSSQVSYRVDQAAPSLTAAPTYLRFAANVETPEKIEQSMLVQKLGTGVSMAFTISKVGNSAWITGISPASGDAGNSGPRMVTITIDTQGLAVGVYVETIRIATSAGQLNVPVTLMIATQSPILSVNNTGLRFEVRQGQGTSVTRNVRVLNLGSPGSVINWSARVARGQGLLTLNPAQGTSVPGNPAALSVSLTSTATDTVGPKYALIEITDPRALNSPQYVTIVVDVDTSDSDEIPQPTPAGLFFSGAQGGAQPQASTIAVNVSSGTPVPFTVSTVTTSGGAWLSTSSQGGITSSSAPAQLNVTVSTAGLAPGVYAGFVNITIETRVRATKIVLLVLPPGAAQEPLRAAAGCTPTRAVIIETSLVNSFSVPAGWPATLVARMVDDCNNPLPGGSIIAEFSNGDAPMSLTGDSLTADYAATWQPAFSAANMIVRLTGSWKSLVPATFEIYGGVNTNPILPPVLVPLGILHNLNAALGGALAPGTVTQVFGDNMAIANAAPSSVPLPSLFRGVELVIGTFSAPIYFVSKNQLTVQLPSELQADRPYAAVLSVNNALSLPEPVNVVPLQPGVAAFPDGRVIAQHLDFSLVDAANPAKPNEPLTIYLAGMGATTQTVASGTASPGSPFAFTIMAPEVTVDGQAAELLFSGLTPSGVGLYQINFRVPAGARTGTLDVVITQNGVAANVTTLPVNAVGPVGDRADGP